MVPPHSFDDWSNALLWRGQMIVSRSDGALSLYDLKTGKMTVTGKAGLSVQAWVPFKGGSNLVSALLQNGSVAQWDLAKPADAPVVSLWEGVVESSKLLTNDANDVLFDAGFLSPQAMHVRATPEGYVQATSNVRPGGPWNYAMNSEGDLVVGTNTEGRTMFFNNLLQDVISFPEFKGPSWVAYLPESESFAVSAEGDSWHIDVWPTGLAALQKIVCGRLANYWSMNHQNEQKELCVPYRK